jgi:DinB superfamily
MSSMYFLPETEYSSFYRSYVMATEGFPILRGLEQGMENLKTLFKHLSKDQWHYQYAEGKWTPKEILLHIIDTERVFAYRALTIARSDNANLPGFDQDEFVRNSKANDRSEISLQTEFLAVRNATRTLFESFSEKELLKIGKANGSDVSVRAMGVIIHGHAQHHARILKERYL